MINSAIVRIVDFCARHRWSVVAAGVLVMLGTGVFSAARFSINTDVEGLISRHLPWHARQLQLTRDFPQKGISAVVRAPTAENAEQAANQLAQTLAKNPKLFPMVGQPDSGDFFERNGLLFDTPADVEKSVGGLTQAQPVISGLAADPSLRGVMKALSFASEGVQMGQIKLQQLSWNFCLGGSNPKRRSIREAGHIFLAGAAAGPPVTGQTAASLYRGRACARFFRPAAWTQGH